MNKVSLIVLCIITLAACGTSHKTTDTVDNVRWPDFLRDWVADSEIEDAKYWAIIDQIDSLYKLIEDGTSDREKLCTMLCQQQNTISDAIVHDTSIFFQLMMRATARNLYGKIRNSPWLVDMNCPCKASDFLMIDAQWYTSSTENSDYMFTTIFESSWQMPNHFAHLVFEKEDGSELAMSRLVVFNLMDTVINNIQITFTDSAGAVLEKLTENDTYVDSSEDCVKIMHVPPYPIMKALANNGAITISYEANNSIVKMVGFPDVYFMEQIEDCPRLKAALDEVLSVQIVPMDDDLKSKIGQPIKQMINRKTGEVIKLDGTYYLDTVWSEKTGSYILEVKQR